MKSMVATARTAGTITIVLIHFIISINSYQIPLIPTVYSTRQSLAFTNKPYKTTTTTTTYCQYKNHHHDQHQQQHQQGIMSLTTRNNYNKFSSRIGWKNIQQRVLSSNNERDKKLILSAVVQPIINGASDILTTGTATKNDNDDDDDPLLLKKIEAIVATAATTTTTIGGSENSSNNNIINELVLPQTESPPISFPKFVTMQERRVVITVRYTQDSGLKPYFLTVAKKLKATHPDVIIERKVLPKDKDGGGDDSDSKIFEVYVDTKVVVGRGGKGGAAFRRSGRIKASGRGVAHTFVSSSSRSIFVSMQELNVAIARARRKRRPNSTYGEINTTTSTSTSTTTTTNTRRISGSTNTSRQHRKLKE